MPTPPLTPALPPHRLPPPPTGNRARPAAPSAAAGAQEEEEREEGCCTAGPRLPEAGHPWRGRIQPRPRCGVTGADGPGRGKPSTGWGTRPAEPPAGDRLSVPRGGQAERPGVGTGRASHGGGDRQSAPGARRGAEPSPTRPNCTHLAPALRTRLFLSTAASILPGTGGTTLVPPLYSAPPAPRGPPPRPGHPLCFPNPEPSSFSSSSAAPTARAAGGCDQKRKQGGRGLGDISPTHPVTGQEGTAWRDSRVQAAEASAGLCLHPSAAGPTGTRTRTVSVPEQGCPLSLSPRSTPVSPRPSPT